MKSIFCASFLLVSSFASANVVKTVSCNNPDIQDNYYSATFQLSNSEIGDSFSTKLRIPSGEYGGTIYSG